MPLDSQFGVAAGGGGHPSVSLCLSSCYLKGRYILEPSPFLYSFPCPLKSTNQGSLGKLQVCTFIFLSLFPGTVSPNGLYVLSGSPKNLHAQDEIMLAVGRKHASLPLERFYFHPSALGNMSCFWTYHSSFLCFVLSLLRKGGAGGEETGYSAVYLRPHCAKLCFAMISHILYPQCKQQHSENMLHLNFNYNGGNGSLWAQKKPLFRFALFL